MRFDLGLGFCALFPIKNFSLIYFYSFSFASDLLFKAISVAFREQERRERAKAKQPTTFYGDEALDRIGM